MIRLFLTAFLAFAVAAPTLTTPGVAVAQSAAEASYWRSIRDSRDWRDFDDYLRRYPYGAYADRAERRAGNLRLVEERRGREQALRLNRGQRREVEARLSRAGFYPGSINGDFNRDTRQAIQRFRRANGLPGHRFLDREMVRVLVRRTGNEYSSYSSGGNRRPQGDRDGEIAAGIVAGALLLGGIILLAD